MSIIKDLWEIWRLLRQHKRMAKDAEEDFRNFNELYNRIFNPSPTISKKENAMLYAYLLQLKNWVHWHYGTLMAFIGKKTICDLDLNIPGKEIEVEAAFYLFYFILELDLIIE